MYVVFNDGMYITDIYTHTTALWLITVFLVAATGPYPEPTEP
jgi:hypothetical protein